MYETEQQARDMANLLVERGFRREDIALLTPSPGAEMATVREAIDHGQLPGSHVNVAAEALRVGRGLVTVKAPFSYEALAEEILDSGHPVDTDKLPYVVPDNPAPFSEFMGFPVLSKRKPYAQLLKGDQRIIFSSFLGLKPLSNKPPRAKLKAFKPFLGLKPLSSNPTPLSSMFRLKLLTEPKGR
jgi:hypothetical protein